MTFDVQDARTFWQAVGQRAVGVAVVTAQDQSGPAGFLSLSVAHLTANPPTLTVAVSKTTSALTALRSGRKFAINYLGTGHEDIAECFGGRTALKGADRFTVGTWAISDDDPPRLVDAVSSMTCVLQEVLERHDTALVIGLAKRCYSSDEAAPLLMFRGSYGSLGH